MVAAFPTAKIRSGKIAKSFRRVYGLISVPCSRNVALQGEYAELDKAEGFLSGNPHALVLNAYVQYNSLYLLGLYRDYNLDFDNSLSTILFQLPALQAYDLRGLFLSAGPAVRSVIYQQCQPQAEKGYYLLSRYQFNRKFILSMEYDNWRG